VDGGFFLFPHIDFPHFRLLGRRFFGFSRCGFFEKGKRRLPGSQQLNAVSGTLPMKSVLFLPFSNFNTTVPRLRGKPLVEMMVADILFPASKRTGAFPSGCRCSPFSTFFLFLLVSHGGSRRSFSTFLGRRMGDFPSPFRRAEIFPLLQESFFSLPFGNSPFFVQTCGRILFFFRE